LEASINNPQIILTNQSSGASSWVWNLGDGNSSSDFSTQHSFNEAGNYIVTLYVSNANGCSDSTKQLISIYNEFTFYCPNTFTPNENLLNDEFLPKGTGWDKSTFEFSIFDRWGNSVFSTNQTNKGWNGKLPSETIKEDVYVWKAQVKDVQGKMHQFIGDVLLLN
jgi:gliding motility-associated-like protein